MPAAQVIDLNPEYKKNPVQENLETFFTRIGKDYRDKKDRMEIGNLIGQYQQNREDANAWEDLQMGLETSDISPTRRLETQKSLNEARKAITEKDKALNAQVKKGMLTQEEKVRQRDNLLKAGWPEYAADVYLDAPPGVKGSLEREHEYLVRHGLRKPLVQVPEGVDEQIPSPEAVTVPDQSSPSGERPILGAEPETPQEKTAANTGIEIKEDEWPDPVSPSNMPPDQKVKWENNNEKENNKDLRETNDHKKALRTNDNLITSMTKINDGKYLPTGVGKFITIDPSTGDIREVANIGEIANPQTQLYIKNLKQWQKGAKEFYGARVTNFDLQSFMQQLPTLMNSEDGRRLILKQMKYTNDLESIYNNTLNDALKHYGRKANFSQVSQVVDDKVKSKEEDLIGKINNIVEASDYINSMADNPDRYKGTVLMQRPNGSFRAVDKDRVQYLKKEKGWRDF